MKPANQAKLDITNKDTLRRRHMGNYSPVANGEIYLLPYEVLLRSKHSNFFATLSDYDHLKDSNTSHKLSLKQLKKELLMLNSKELYSDFWKNFNDSALKLHLNTILGTTKSSSDVKGWRKTFLKVSQEIDAEKPHHDDMLKCIYLLAHLHKASPSFIRQLAAVDDAWSAELRVFYPRKDFAFSEEYGSYLAELYTNILYHQPESIRKIVKNLDCIIDKLVKNYDKIESLINGIFERRSEDIDSPGLKILKYNQIASITHNQALSRLLAEKVTSDIFDNSFIKLKKRKHQGLASSDHYWLVAVQCFRSKIGQPMTKIGTFWQLEDGERISGAEVDEFINLYANALSTDALNCLTFESDRTKTGKKDTSIPAAIRQMADQNPQSVEEILGSLSLDYANIPEIYSKYVTYRTEYSRCYCLGIHEKFVRNMIGNEVTDIVLNYIKGNNLAKLYLDLQEIEVRIQECEYLSGRGIMFFEPFMHYLPTRV